MKLELWVDETDYQDKHTLSRYENRGTIQWRDVMDRLVMTGCSLYLEKFDKTYLVMDIVIVSADKLELWLRA